MKDNGDGSGRRRRGEIRRATAHQIWRASRLLPALLPAAVLWPRPAAADWQSTFDATAGVIATDNVNLTPEKKGGLEPMLGGGFSVRGSGDRGAAAADGQIFGIGRIGGGKPDFQPLVNLLSTGTGIAVPDWLFVDGQASMSRAPTISNAPTSQNPGAALGNQTSVSTLGISPYLRHRFDWGDAEIRYRFQHLFLGGVGGGGPSAGVADANRNEQDVLLSREAFGRAKLSFDGRHDDLKSYNVGGLGSLTRTYGRAAAEYAINRQVSLTASAGYERDVIATAPSIDEPLWNVGVILRPGPRLEIEAAWGRRYGRQNVYALARYRVSQGAVAGVLHSETLQSYTERFLEADIARGVDAQGRIIDTRTGAPQSFGTALGGVPSINLTERGVANPGVFLVRSNSAWLQFPGASSSLLMQAYYDLISPMTPTSLSETDYGGRARWTQTLSTRTSGYLDLLYGRSRVGPTPGVDTVSEQVGLQRALSERMSAVIAYTRTDRITGPTTGRYHENAIMLFVSRTL